MNKNDDDISILNREVDVDEEDPNVIYGFCTPVNVDEEYTLPFAYLKTTKPIAVDSAIANGVWDTIIEEEEEGFEEVRLIIFSLIQILIL